MGTALSGKNALVTGASRGIGKAIALALANAGGDVVVNYLSKGAEADTTVDAIRRLGRRAVALQADVSNSTDVQRLVQAAEREIGPIDILVNNAGRVLVEGLDQMSEASWNDIIRVNLTSV